MKKTMRLSVLAMGIAVLGAHGYSNPIEGGSTEFVTNQWNVAMPWLMVGGNSSSNRMFVWNGGRVDSQIGYIGNNATSMENKVFVSGTNAVWNSSMEIAVGNQGSDNTLGIYGGGRVDTANAYIGKASSNNFTAISGSGSELRATTLHVGHTGSDNDLGVFDGGRMSSADGSIGYWVGSDDNMAFVTGTNSVWNNTGVLNVGEHGSDNHLMIVDGGTVQSPVVNLGVESTSSNNAISVWGNGALLDAPELNIGGSTAGAGGTGNRVSVRDGGTVATTDLNIYAGNDFDLNDGGTLAVSTNFNAAMSGFNFNSGGTLEVGGELTGMGSEIEDQRTIVMNGSNALWNTVGSDLHVGNSTDGNQLIIEDGGRVENSVGYIGDASGADSNSVLVTGTDSVWKNTEHLYVGYASSGNRLTIEDGAHLESVGGQIGTQAGASNNMVVVRGQNSVWIANPMPSSGYPIFENNSDLYPINYPESIWEPQQIKDPNALFVGKGGSGNRLEILDGAQVQGSSAYIGYDLGANNNHVVVAGEGSILQVSRLMMGCSWGYVTPWESAAHELFLDGGIGNSLTVTNGGWVVVGDSADLPQWGSGILVGSGTGSAEMVVANGSQVESGHLIIGMESNQVGSVVLRDEETIWKQNGQVVVGANGSGNKLTLEEGASFSSIGGTIGQSAGANNNTVVARGSNTVWSMRLPPLGGGGILFPPIDPGYNYPIMNPPFIGIPETDVTPGSTIMDIAGLVIGEKGADNRLDILDGGVVQSGRSWIGMKPGADSNSVVVAGSGSQWQARSLTMGGAVGFVGPYSENGRDWFNGGTGNSLTVTNGGWVQVGDIGTNNIPDHGTRGVVSVSGAEMIVANGSRVSNDIGYIGLGADETGAVTVKGTNSVWSNSTRLYVGHEGSGNSLVVSDGGHLESLAGYIGYGESASSNSVLITGADSVWKIPSRYFLTGSNAVFSLRIPRSEPSGLNVGYMGSRNSLVISDGALVESVGGRIGVKDGANHNSVLVSGTDSVWRPNLGNASAYVTMDICHSGGSVLFEGPFFVGDAGSSNRLDILEGGRVYADDSAIGNESSATYNQVRVAGTNSLWQAGAHLHVGKRGGNNALVIENGGIVSSSSGNVGFMSSDNQVLLSGVDSRWEVSSRFVALLPDSPGVLEPVSSLDTISYGSLGAVNRDMGWGDSVLSIGRRGSHNVLRIENGAAAYSRFGSIGFSGGSSNRAEIVGTDSRWVCDDGFFLGGRMENVLTGYVTPTNVLATASMYPCSRTPVWIDGGTGNSLYIGDGGLVSVGRDMHNRNYSTVSIDPGGHISISSNYYQDATSVLRFGVETNAVGAPLNALVSVGGTAEFEEGATLQYHSNVGLLDFDTFYTNLIVEADTLIVGGVTNANALDLEAINLDGSLVDVLLWEQDQDIYGLVGRKYLADSAGFTEGSMMARLSKEIDDLSLLGNPGAVAQINLLNGMSAEQQNQQLTQLYTQGVPTYQHQQGMQGGQKQVLAQSRGFQADNRTPASQPEGAAGPHEAEQGLRGWMRGYGNWAEREESDSFSDFSQNAYGTVVGLDRAFGSVLLGAAGGYAYSDLTQENRDSSNAKIGFGVLYGSFGSTDWFGDLNVSYGRSRIETRSGTLFGATGTSDADNYSAYLGGGKEISLADGEYLFTPEAALLVGYFDQEGYSDGLRDIDAYDRWSYQSRLGASIAFPRKTDSVVWKPEARIYWLHEFNADFDQVGYSLVGGSGRYVFGVQAPVEDLIEAGVGLSATVNDRLEIVFDVDGQYSGDYEAITVSGRFIYEF